MFKQIGDQITDTVVSYAYDDRRKSPLKTCFMRFFTRIASHYIVVLLFSHFLAYFLYYY